MKVIFNYSDSDPYGNAGVPGPEIEAKTRAVCTYKKTVAVRQAPIESIGYTTLLFAGNATVGEGKGNTPEAAFKAACENYWHNLTKDHP